MNNVWVMVNRYESWLNYYISENISQGYIFEIFKITDFNREDFINEKKDVATLGGSALDFIVASDGSPYRAVSKLRFESAIGIRDLMVPLKTSYTDSANNGESGRPVAKDEEISPSGDRTRNTSE